MAWVLILFLHVNQGTSAITIPVQSESLCRKYEAYFIGKYERKWSSRIDVMGAECIRVKDE